MSDDLVKQWDEYIESMGCVMGEVEHMAQKMRNRIEELEKRNASLEAKLAKAVEGLEQIARPKVGPDFDWAELEVIRWQATWYRRYERIARTTLAELIGGKDE